MEESHLNISSGWAASEFGMVNFGDKRLNIRLHKIADSLSDSPESSINQACEEWSQTKAAYRFFQNDAISEGKILDSHVKKTVERASKYSTILAIQDTCYISYKNHKKTRGLGVIASRKFDNDSAKKEQNTGVLFQIHTQLLVNGFMIILVSLLLIFNAD